MDHAGARAAAVAAVAAALLIPSASARPPAAVTAYPRLAEPLSTAYTVAVRSAGSPWRAVPVYRVAVDYGDPSVAALATFGMRGQPVEVAVTVGTGTMHDATVEPAAAGIAPHLGGDGRTATFTLAQPANVAFEVDGDRAHALHLFADPPGDTAPAAHAGRAIVFAAGAHDLPGDHVLHVPSDTTVYLAPGAVVRGTIELHGVHGVTIRGPGIVDPSRYFDASGGVAGILVDGSSDVGLEDVTILRGQNGGVTVVGSHDVVLENVKEINADRWSDGLDVASSSHVLVDHCFFRTSDDAIAVWATNPFAGSGSSSDLAVRNTTLWPDVAHGILVGPYGRPGGHDAIEDVQVSNVDVLEQDEPQSLYAGAIGLEAGDSLTEERLAFTNVRVARVTRGRALDVHVYLNPNENRTAGDAIRHVVFRDVEVPAGSTSEIGGYDAGRTVSDVQFEGLRRGGEVATYAASAGVAVDRYATDIRFRSVDVRRTAGRGPLRFRGSEATVTARVGPSGGIADVYVDGKRRGTVDTYSAQPSPHVQVFDTGVLAEGEHTVEVRPTGRHDRLSTASAVALDGFGTIA